MSFFRSNSFAFSQGS